MDEEESVILTSNDNYIVVWENIFRKLACKSYLCWMQNKRVQF